MAGTGIQGGSAVEPVVEVIAIDDEGVLGGRVGSHMWGPLVQCESLLRNNAVSYALGNDEIAPAQIILVATPYYENPYAKYLQVSYQPEGRPLSLRDGRPVSIALDGRTISVRGIDVVGSIARFIDALSDSHAATSSLTLSIRVEELVGSASHLYLLLGQLIDERANLTGDIVHLLRRQDELQAEVSLLRTQIAEPDERKVRWATSSMMISLVTIAALVQGADALISVAEHLNPLAHRVGIAVADAIARCGTLLD